MKRAPATLFEVSWEVCHRVGGIHTAVSTKARRMAERLGDAYVLIGPWLLSGEEARDFEPDPAFDAFADGCRAAGLPVRVGRWKILGNPRTVLVEFSGLYQKRDDLLRDLWERHRVDSLFGEWDYIEPVLFGCAAAIVIERWFREIDQPAGGPAVAHFHEWMTGAGLLHVSERLPEIGTVFTAHATVLGRALAATGVAPLSGLGERTSEQVAETANVRAKHSLEAAVVRRADVFTTVSEIAAEEARLFHGRDADPVVPNGWDEDVMRGRAAPLARADAARLLRDVASRFIGEDLSDAAIVLTTGRYDLHNKGFDLLLDAASDLNERRDDGARRIVVFLIVPAGSSGLRREVAERLRGPVPAGGGLRSPGVCTHALFDAERDAIAVRCRARRLDNAPGSRVKIIHVGAFVDPADGVFSTTYEALVQGADVTAFPSFYDPWGYTPQESLALGVPTITTDCTGFGRYMLDAGTPRRHGLSVLRRRDRSDPFVRRHLAAAIERHLEGPREDEKWIASCREIAATTEWAHLVRGHEAAHRKARDAARQRTKRRGAHAAPTSRTLPARPAARVSRPHVFVLDVAPQFPPALDGLHEIVRNWRWTWDPEACDVLRDLSPATWDRTGHDPLRVLREAPQADVDARAADPEWCARLDAALARHRAYLAEPQQGGGAWPSAQHPVAYVCAEYGIHESLPIYSGGLGALAGDHVKSASDLGVPLVAVGLLYRRGYMRQRLEGGTDQSAGEDRLDPAYAAIEPVLDAAGRPVEITLTLPGTTLAVRAWRAAVGRVPLLLLDTDVESNRPEDRAVTHQLYGGDAEMRLRQEIVLGFGGARMLAAVGIEPCCFHVNEGHGAFTVLERTRTLLRDRGLTFDEAREVVRATTAFTTHTPVPAGHDRFGEDLMRRYFSDVTDWLRIPWERFVALGAAPDDPTGFNMTQLAVGFATFTNAVSRKHADVSRALLRSFCPWLLEDEVPVTSVTNGVHVGGWTHVEIARCLRGAAAPAGAVTAHDFRHAESLAPAALWAARRRMRAALADEMRTRLRRSAAERGDAPSLTDRILAGIDAIDTAGAPGGGADAAAQGALVIGFARRFATYKRADLILRDPGRLRALLDAPGRPVRVIYAGKAHPRDSAGRELLSRIAALARSDEFAGRVFVLENYDLALARTLVAGVDVWLNNPRAPLEASGTSGMKAACNGVLNLSIGDGWWLEAFDGTNGWRIGDEAVAAGDAAQDEHDYGSLFALLEHDVVPLFFERDAAGVPHAWMRRAARSMATVPPVFDTARMVAEYRERAYGPLAHRSRSLSEADFAPARSLAQRRARIHRGLAAMRVVSASVTGCEAARTGDALVARVDLALGDLTPGDVVVELVAGPRDASGEIRDPVRTALPPAGAREGEVQRFAGAWTVPGTGAYGYGLRVRPLVGPEDDGPSFHDPAVWA